jgi:uncharacterized membrane protein YiaA
MLADIGVAIIVFIGVAVVLVFVADAFLDQRVVVSMEGKVWVVILAPAAVLSVGVFFGSRANPAFVLIGMILGFALFGLMVWRFNKALANAKQ